MRAGPHRPRPVSLRTYPRACVALLTAALGGACKGDPAGSGDDDSGSGTDGGSSSTMTASASMTSAPTSATTNTSPSTDPDVTGDPTGQPGDVLYTQDFEGADGSDWPAPWAIIGDNLLGASLQGGRGMIQGVTMGTGRIYLPGFDANDVDILVTIAYDNFFEQGIGFYGRQNGGALTQTDPAGLGYAVFYEGGYQQALGLWREVDGVEERLAAQMMPIAGGPAAGAPYRVRFQVEQQGDGTALRAKIWPADEAEPDAWGVEVVDATPELQNIGGSFAADVYNYASTHRAYFDDLVITAL